MEALVKTYDEVFYERADARVKDWPLMRSPWALFIILASYLTIVNFILPAYMKNRKPYNLRTIIKWYNIALMVANTVVAWGIMTSGWTTTYHLGCLLPDYSMNPEALRMLRFMWWTIVLKIVELPETMFFLLRKKDNQASFLHIYHHCVTPIMIWTGVKYVGGGMASFPPMINSMIHVVMYAYYLLSIEGSPAVKKFVKKYKMYLTILQMIQFTVLLIYIAQIFLPHCSAPKATSIVFFPNVIIVYYLFYDFFKKNYGSQSKLKENVNVNDDSVSYKIN